MHITHINLARGFAGGERQTVLLIRYLSGRQVDQRLICRKDSPLRKHMQFLPGLNFHTAGNMFAGHRFGRIKTDLLHAHDAKAAHWAFLETRFRHLPYLITRRVPNPLKQYGVTPHVYRRAAAVVAISSGIRGVLEAYGPAIPLTTIPSAMGNIPAREGHVRELKNRYNGLFVIGHIGTLKDRAKGQMDIIAAARRLNSQYNNLHFVLVGKGDDEARLKSEAKGINNMEFAGFTEYPGDYLAVMDLFVFPSPNEGLGSSILDAMAYGVPVIASDVGGIPDIVEHEQNGLLIPPRNSRALADAISRLYENPGLRKQFSDKGRETAATFSPEAMGERYLALYRKILGG